jgi:UDP-GlcNAc:undecaprenyl-phosphate GlcNAc-1-phosphate transferase
MPLAGIVLAAPLLAWTVSAGLWLLAAGIAVAAGIGFFDDRTKDREQDLSWQTKALFLLAAAGLAAAEAASPTTSPWQWLGLLLAIFVLTNATNFLDNTDGVAAMLSATSLLALSGGQGPLAAAGFAALGFLPCNWPRPRAFLGDSGAYALGVCCGYGLATRLHQGDALWLAALPLAVQLIDFVQVLTARLWLGVSPFVGDRRHLTHVLQNVGIRPWLVAPLLAGLAVAIAAAGNQLRSVTGS